MIFLLSFLFLCLIVFLFLRLEKFGSLPIGKRLEIIKKSPNYRDGKFQNSSVTPDLTEGANLFSVMAEFTFRKSKRNKPKGSMPSQKTDLRALDLNENIIVWFGHSSYFLQVDGKKILVDPVFSGAASPLNFTTRSFPGSDVYSTDDFPEIDFLFISHDHWDHLDHLTVKALKPKVKKAITGLGTGAHLERWGYDPSAILEKDWNQKVDLGGGFSVNILPARHFSGRGFKRNQALWVSFALKTPSKNIFLGGDSGYDAHFSKIGDSFGPFDLAILECGQYDKSWKYIHLMPEEMMKAVKDLKAKAMMPVHWGKFSLGNHDWDEPVLKVTEAAKAENFPLLTPMIGEKVSLDAPQPFESWWKNVD